VGAAAAAKADEGQGTAGGRQDPVAVAMATGLTKSSLSSTPKPGGKAATLLKPLPAPPKRRRLHPEMEESEVEGPSDSESEEEEGVRDGDSSYVGEEADDDSNWEDEKRGAKRAAVVRPARKKQRVGLEEAAAARYPQLWTLAGSLAQALGSASPYTTKDVAVALAFILDGISQARAAKRLAELTALFRETIRPWRVRAFLIKVQTAESGFSAEELERFYTLLAFLTRRPVDVRAQVDWLVGWLVGGCWVWVDPTIQSFDLFFLSTDTRTNNHRS
jgi:hypothetical protein